MNKALSILLIVAIVSMCGCVDIPRYNNQEILDEYNEYIGTWNKDVRSYNTYFEVFSTTLDDYNHEVEIYNAAYFDDGTNLAAAEECFKDAQLEYKYNALIIKGRLDMFRTFLYDNRDTLERNGVDVRGDLNGIN